MKLKTKLYIVAALLLMLLGNFIGRIMYLTAILVVVAAVAYFGWPLIRPLLAKLTAKRTKV